MKLIDYPVHVSERIYGESLDRMAGKLLLQDGVDAIYQIGGVTHAGISDIDMFVVFDDEAECLLNPLAELEGTDPYLFIHNLYGMNKSRLEDVKRFTFFHNFRHMHGNEYDMYSNDLSAQDVTLLKRQVAFEYLVKMYVNMTVERAYNILKLRGVLLHVKGLLYDMEFLEISSSKLKELIELAIYWRDHWFNSAPAKTDILKWHAELYAELKTFLVTAMAQGALYLPEKETFFIANNMRIRQSAELGFIRKGFNLPSMFAGLGRKYFNVQHRWNDFEFNVPYERSNLPDYIHARFEFIREMNEYNKRKIPYFLLPASSLPIFR